jgi:hypothetical protein
MGGEGYGNERRAMERVADSTVWGMTGGYIKPNRLGKKESSAEQIVHDQSFRQDVWSAEQLLKQ